jgi:hypothetical protein
MPENPTTASPEPDRPSVSTQSGRPPIPAVHLTDGRGEGSIPEASTEPRHHGLVRIAALFLPKSTAGRLTVLAMICSVANVAGATIGLFLFATAFIIAVVGSLRQGKRLRRTLVRIGEVIIGLVVIRETAMFLAFLTSGGTGQLNFSRADVFGSLETYVVLATFVLVLWVPQVFFTIGLDLNGTGEAQRVLLSVITAAACGLTATYFVMLHFSGGPLRSIPPGPLTAAIIGTILLVAPLYKALARLCWRRGLGGALAFRVLRQRWRNTITELGRALERGSQ